jgi:hypothetical protein
VNVPESTEEGAVTGLEELIDDRTLEREGELQVRELSARRLGEIRDLLANGGRVAIAENRNGDHRRQRQNQKREGNLRDSVGLSG